MECYAALAALSPIAGVQGLKGGLRVGPSASLTIASVPKTIVRN